MSKRNFNQKLSKKNWKVIIIAVVIAIFASALVFNLTDGYDNINLKDNLSIKLNEDNLFFEKIEDGEIFDNVQITANAKNGIITLKGDIVDTDPSSIDDSDPLGIATLTIPAGTYTFTCFDTPTYKNYYAIGTFEIDDEEYTWYADFDSAPNNPEDDSTLLGKTVTFEEETEVTFEIVLKEGAKLNNVKAYPVVVEGDQDGSYYNGFFK